MLTEKQIEEMFRKPRLTTEDKWSRVVIALAIVAGIAGIVHMVMGG